jgi:putative nucleotidyltransferase with HDIG domain
MKAKTKIYGAVVAVAALAAAAALTYVDPSPSQATRDAVILLCSLAFVAEMMTFVLSRSLAGSIAFIPYLALIIVAPSWLSLAGSSGIRLLADRRREPCKVFFNLAQQGVTFSLTALLYRFLGGVALYELKTISLAAATLRVGLPSIIAIICSLAINSLLVSGFIAVNGGKRVFIVWREVFLSTVGLDLLAAPVIFIFAWVYVAFGAIAAAAIWLPILGIRQFHMATLALERTNQELLELMVKSIEARDPYTSGHSRRVRLYSVTIARALGLPEKVVDRIGRAALLHDVGKIHEKYAPILRNPNRLSSDEWLVMKEHPIDGANLVSTVSGLSELIPAIRAHHENWDGTGYPNSLKGDDIPLEARIITFADTIDAMTSERPYRPALGEQQVRSEILKARGSQFDPQLADRIMAPAVWNVLFPPNAERAGKGIRLVTASEEAALG